MTLIAVLFALATGPAATHDPYYLDRTVGAASELVGWCRAEAEARYAAKGVSTYQWTSSYHDRGNTLFVEGKLRANGNDIPVHCRIARGAQLRYASIEIDDPTL
ncbi:hypothetical protein [Pseudoxanthomonas putridarboris]|uniref:YD repeat-containing protein n=1 Tax=Pseudoxanthomonas putridarboris TaxID=752605 RepID=A0ABU9IWH0_9GAMM